MKKERLFTNIAVIYFIFGLIFAITFATYYKWEMGSFLSPGFYMVVLTWPLQAFGFVSDLLRYGLEGKPI
jgi:hypothetical protein